MPWPSGMAAVVASMVVAADSMAAWAAAISAASLTAEVSAVGTAVSLASIPAASLTDPRLQAAAGAAVASAGATADGAAMATVPRTPGLVCSVSASGSAWVTTGLDTARLTTIRTTVATRTAGSTREQRGVALSSDATPHIRHRANQPTGLTRSWQKYA